MLLARAQNPLIPSGYDVLWSLVALAVLSFALAAVVSIARTRDVTGFRALLWIVAVLALPVVGGILWFAVGRQSTTAART